MSRPIKPKSTLTTSEQAHKQARKAAELWLNGQSSDVDYWLAGSQLKLLYLFTELYAYSHADARNMMQTMLRRRKAFTLQRAKPQV